MMPKIVDKIVDINIFQDVFGAIDQNFIKSIVSIASLFEDDGKNFLMMTKDSTFAYGERICEMLSLKYDPFKPQKISQLDDIKIVQVDSGENFVVILTNDGHVYLASDDDVWNTKKTFKLITVSNNDDRFKMIACGAQDLLLLRQDGTVFKSIQVSNSNGILSKSIEIINLLRNVKLIACGPEQYFALTNREKIYSWGDNKCGQLGLGSDTKSACQPISVQFHSASIVSLVKDIATGDSFSLFLLENGELYFYGRDLADTYSTFYFKNGVFSPKLVLSQVERIATSKYKRFALAYSESSYYVFGYFGQRHWPSFTKLDDQFESFAAVVEKFNPSPFTFGLTSTFYLLEDCKYSLRKPEESIRLLFDNPENYDIEFIVGQQKQRILACKCYLKSVSEYFHKMLSGEWRENDRIMIDSYSYDTYYSYLNMLHCGPKDSIKINADNIGELTDLAHCYCDEKLLEYCKNFIRKELNEKTVQIYLPLIVEYQLNEFNDKLGLIAYDKLFLEIQNGSIQDFLQNHLGKQQSSLQSSSESIDSSNKKRKIK